MAPQGGPKKVSEIPASVDYDAFGRLHRWFTFAPMDTISSPLAP